MDGEERGTDPSAKLIEPGEGRFRLLVESVRDYAVFMLDPRGHVLTWNTGAERIKGYRAEEIIGRHLCEFYPPELRASGFADRELEVAACAGSFEDEGWRVRKDGSLFWANVVITAMRDASGQLVGFSTVLRDLTQQRNREESLRRSEERLRLLFEGVVRDLIECQLAEATVVDRLARDEAPVGADIADIRRRVDSLSRREHEVMNLVVKGLLNKQAAAMLDIAEITIKVHRRRVMQKMGARSLPELVRLVERAGPWSA